MCFIILSKDILYDETKSKSFLANGASIILKDIKHVINFCNEFYVNAQYIAMELPKAKLLRKQTWKLAHEYLKNSKENVKVKDMIVEIKESHDNEQKLSKIKRLTSVISPLGLKKLIPGKVFEINNEKNNSLLLF